MADARGLLRRDIFCMTIDDWNDEARASLSQSHVYRLIALEQVEMDRRAAERRASNVIYLRGHAAKACEPRLERKPRCRSAG